MSPNTDNEERKEKYEDLSQDYYDNGATELYELGWSSSFHFCRFNNGEPFPQAQARHEHFLALQIGLKPGMRVLDVGCGVGAPAIELARFIGVEIVGVNNNEYQVRRARSYAKKAGVSHLVNFVTGDFMKLSEQFGENTFDAVFSIEATLYAPSWEGCYGEILKVLKPGGVFGVYEWGMTKKWDPSIPEHQDLARRLAQTNGISEVRSAELAIAAMKKVGFQLLLAQDVAEFSVGDELPWYYPLEGNWKRARTMWDYFTCWRLSWHGKLVCYTAVGLAEMVGLASKGSLEVLKIAGTALVEAGQKGVFTPMLLLVGKKPDV